MTFCNKRINNNSIERNNNDKNKNNNNNNNKNNNNNNYDALELSSGLSRKSLITNRFGGNENGKTKKPRKSKFFFSLSVCYFLPKPPLCLYLLFLGPSRYSLCLYYLRFELLVPQRYRLVNVVSFLALMSDCLKMQNSRPNYS